MAVESIAEVSIYDRMIDRSMKDHELVQLAIEKLPAPSTDTTTLEAILDALSAKQLSDVQDLMDERARVQA